MYKRRVKDDRSRVPLVPPPIELRVALGSFRDC